MSTLLQEAESWTAAHKTRDGGTWNQWCASLMVRFNNLPGSYLSAILAYRASKIVSLDYSKAPVGAFHFWDIGEFGHVAQDLTAGGRVVLMASAKVEKLLGEDIGLTGVHAYTVRTGAKYLGWSLKFGSMAPRAASDLGHTYSTTVAKPVAVAGPKFKWVEPDKATQKAIQTALRARKRYAGPRDGDWGIESIKGIMESLRGVGYTGIIDGKPGINTCHYVQVYAQKFGGYKGKIDNVLEKDVWAAFLKGLKK